MKTLKTTKMMKIIDLPLSVFLVAFGFNTIDSMIWEFYWREWRLFAPNLWAWTPTLYLDVWISYIFGGILPIILGSVLMGKLLVTLKSASTQED